MNSADGEVLSQQLDTWCAGVISGSQVPHLRFDPSRGRAFLSRKTPVTRGPEGTQDPDGLYISDEIRVRHPALSSGRHGKKTGQTLGTYDEEKLHESTMFQYGSWHAGPTHQSAAEQVQEAACVAKPHAVVTMAQQKAWQRKTCCVVPWLMNADLY